MVGKTLPKKERRGLDSGGPRISTLRIAKTNLAIKWFPEPPKDFDPLTASERLLRFHGFPRRPDAIEEPELRARWERGVGRIRRRVYPRFQVVKDRFHGPLLSRARLAGTTTSANWAGSYVVPPANDSFQWVAGEWTVPDCSATYLGSGNYYSAEWVGIDGALQNSADVVQAGTASDYSGNKTSVYAWWEWYPMPQVTLDGFPVATGDLMYCLMCVLPDSSNNLWAGFSLLNETSGALAIFSVQKPSWIQFSGNTAEWIVEAPAQGSIFGGNTVLPLADFGAVYIGEDSAGTIKGKTIDGVDPAISTLVYLYGSKSNVLLSQPTAENNQLVKITRLATDTTT